MTTHEEAQIIQRIRHSLDQVNRYLQVVDRAENIRRGEHPDARSPITREMAQAFILLDQLERGAHTASAGDLLSHVVDTEGDPARVREGMTDREANGLMWDSLIRAGTPAAQAQAIADIYVPITDGSGSRAENTFRLRDFPAGTTPRPISLTSPALADRGTSWQDREESAQATHHAPTPRDVASRIHREEAQDQ